MQQIIKKIKKNRHSIWSISLLSVQAVFLGIFVSLFFIDSTANFLVFHTVRVLPEAFVASGLAGIIIIQIINAIEALKSKQLRYFIQYGIILLCFISLIGLQFLTYTKFFLFFYFAAFLPFSIILINIQHATVANIKASNNFVLSIIIDVLFLSGTVLGGIWALLFKRTNTIPVEYILAAILAVVFILQLGIYHFKATSDQISFNKPIKTLVSYFSEIPLKGVLLVTALFILFSTISFTMIDFTFLQTVESLYKSTVSLTKFLVLFFLVTTILSFVFKLFVYQNLIKNFKLNKAIIFAPIISILALVGISTLMLFPARFNFDTAYSLLFLGLVFTRIFVQLIRESFEFYGLKLNFVSQESVSNRKIDREILSLFDFWAFFFSGMILLIIKSIEINNVQLRIVLNLLVAIAWFVIAIALNKGYHKSIHRFVSGLLNANHSTDGKEMKYRGEFEGSNLSYLRYILNYQSYYQPHHFRKLIKQLPDNLKLKLGITLNKNNFIDARIPDNNTASKLKTIGSSNTFFDTTKASKGYMIESLTESISIEDRVMAVRLITESRNPKYINILKLLIRDSDDEVKRQAISAITKFKNIDLIYEALEYLNHEDYADLVCDVLLEMGEIAVFPLSQTFNKPNISIKYQSKIIKTIAQIPSDESNRFLLNKLEYPNKNIVYESALALNKLKFRPDSSDSQLLLRVIEKTISNCAWLLNMSNILDKEDKTEQLNNNLKEEFNNTFELLFILLELKYGKKLVEYIKQSRAEGSSNEHKEYGIEILNIVVDSEIKPKLFPLLHNNSIEEIIRQLQNQFPIAKKTSLMAIKEIINIDLGYISKWTKSSAIIALSHLQDVSLSEDIIAQLYNPEPILSESAVYSIKKWGNNNLGEIESRLPDRIFPKILLLSENIDLNKYFLLNQKVFYLKRLPYFSLIKGENLLHLAEEMEGILLLAGNFQTFETRADELLPLFTTPHGEIIISDGGSNSKKLPKGHLYGLSVYSGKIKFEAVTDSFMYVLRPENLTSVVLNFDDISDALFTYLNDSKIH